jgi:hypothetical protein
LNALSLELRVRDRAGNRCEYCKMHQWLQGATFHVEHVVPRSRGGADGFDNLALACPSCNLHKSDRISAIDPLTGVMTSLFNPRRDNWREFFEFADFSLLGKIASARVTIELLDLNHARKIQIRMAEKHFGLFPP